MLESHQRRGIGAALMRFGLDAVEKAGYPYVIVLGHPEYYPRFGFERASQFGVACEFPGVDDAAFMLLPFNEGIVESLSGVVHYRKEFSS